jgi:predicted ATPase
VFPSFPVPPLARARARLAGDDTPAVWLRHIGFRPEVDVAAQTAFPFTVPAIRSLEPLALTSPVTFFVGANGSGKSTLLEALAAAIHLPTVGSDDIDRDATLDAQRTLAAALRLTWSKRVRRGFFLRAEDFFGFSKRVAQMRAELRQRLADIEIEYAGRTALAKGLASGPVHASLGELQRSYGDNLDAHSHGESFLQLFEARFVPDGIYLLDEPEAALSPTSQLAFLALMRQMVVDGAQFIIATHSPVVLAYPAATIFSFDSLPVAPTAFEELEHVRLTREFLNAPERYLRHLGFDNTERAT